MNIANQLKTFRSSKQISQDELADIIHVSRQTISSWENNRSYPDIHSLILLSEFYEVSLDELVKGDITMMKEKLEIRKMNRLSYLMLTCFCMMVVTMPIGANFGTLYFLIPLFFMISMLIISLRLEKLKKEKNIQTYEEILNYMETGALPNPNKTKSRKKIIVERILFAVCSAIVAFVLVYTFMKIF